VAAAADPSGAAGVLVTVHQRLGYALLAVLVVGLVLALLAVRDVRRLPTVRAYLWLTVAALVLQGIAGISLLLVGERPAEGLHVVYGPLTLVSLPLTVLFARGWAPRREAWTFAAGFLVALLLAIRALMTG
jgi:heme A synthase